MLVTTPLPCLPLPPAMTRFLPALLTCTCCFSFTVDLLADRWPQFRGANASGVSNELRQLPAEIGPEQNVHWQVDLSPGVSSPVIVDERLYVTAVREENQLVTIAIDTGDGRVVWESAAPTHKIEQTDSKPLGRLATPTPAADGKHVVVFFGSSGLLCYDTDGKLLWHREMGPFENTRGATSSPIIVGERVILVEDHEVGSFIAAFDLKTGETIWKTERSLFNRSYGTPVVWKNGATSYVVAVGSGLVTAYELDSGKPAFFAQGTSAVANPSPVVGEDNTLYVNSANPGPKREYQPSFAKLLERDDANRDGRLTKEEMPNGLFQNLFASYDEDHSGDLSSSEYSNLQRLLGTCRNGMIALKPGGDALDRTDTNVLWHIKKSIPRTASPIYSKGHLYVITDGGVFSSINATTGEVVKSGRTPARGKFFGSPVLGDGKIYFASDRGELVVISAQPDWKVLSSADFGEPIYPTPAISAGRIYLRTETRLFCFAPPRNVSTP